MDEAKYQLDELEKIVVADIYVAHNNFETLRDDTVLYAGNTFTEGHAQIGTESIKIGGYLEIIKNLGNGGNIDMTQCLQDDEPYLLALPQNKIDSMEACIAEIIQTANNTIDSGKYIVDILYNKIQQFNFQLNMCSDNDLTCISLVLTEIQKATVELPQTIKIQVETTSNDVLIQKPPIVSCQNIHVADYASEANTLITKIASCIDA